MLFPNCLCDSIFSTLVSCCVSFFHIVSYKTLHIFVIYFWKKFPLQKGTKLLMADNLYCSLFHKSVRHKRVKIHSLFFNLNVGLWYKKKYFKRFSLKLVFSSVLDKKNSTPFKSKYFPKYKINRISSLVKCFTIFKNIYN